MQQFALIEQFAWGGLLGAGLSAHGPWCLAQPTTLRLCWHFLVSLCFAGCGSCCQSREYLNLGAGLVVSGSMVWVVGAWSVARGSRTLVLENRVRLKLAALLRSPL